MPRGCSSLCGAGRSHLRFVERKSVCACTRYTAVGVGTSRPYNPCHAARNRSIVTVPTSPTDKHVWWRWCDQLVTSRSRLLALQMRTDFLNDLSSFNTGTYVLAAGSELLQSQNLSQGAHHLVAVDSTHERCLRVAMSA